MTVPSALATFARDPRVTVGVFFAATSGPRVRTLIGFEEAGTGNVRVPLRRADAGVPQQFLNGPDVRSSLQQMRRERMPERVGRGAAARQDDVTIPFHEAPHVTCAERAAAPVDEQ